MTQAPFDVSRAHRWFAVEFNNRGWELVEQSSRTEEESREMIHAAHAAAIHWQAVGTPLNAQRAENLLATAYLRAGLPQLALRHAQRGLALSAENAAAGTETPFDRACALGAAAAASALTGDTAEAARLADLASAAAATL